MADSSPEVLHFRRSREHFLAVYGAWLAGLPWWRRPVMRTVGGFAILAGVLALVAGLTLPAVWAVVVGVLLLGVGPPLVFLPPLDGAVVWRQSEGPWGGQGAKMSMSVEGDALVIANPTRRVALPLAAARNVHRVMDHTRVEFDGDLVIFVPYEVDAGHPARLLNALDRARAASADVAWSFGQEVPQVEVRLPSLGAALAWNTVVVVTDPGVATAALVMAGVAGGGAWLALAGLPGGAATALLVGAVCIAAAPLVAAARMLRHVGAGGEGTSRFAVSDGWLHCADRGAMTRHALADLRVRRAPGVAVIVTGHGQLVLPRPLVVSGDLRRLVAALLEGT